MRFAEVCHDFKCLGGPNAKTAARVSGNFKIFSISRQRRHTTNGEVHARVGVACSLLESPLLGLICSLTWHLHRLTEESPNEFVEPAPSVDRCGEGHKKCGDAAEAVVVAQPQTP